MIPYGRQNISQEDINSVVDVLKSDFLTQGNVVPAFEAKIKDYCGVSNAIAVNSATSGLHIACLALGVKPGDIVWTSPISFVASANCALYCGASIDFVDIDPSSYNMSIEALTKKLEIAKQNGILPKVIIPVHLTGQSCDMLALSKLAKTYNFQIIEDASHCIGGEYLNKKIGSCEYSDVSVFSFHPVKIITTGEGGMVTTGNDEVAKKLFRLRTHGITRNTDEMTKDSDGPWYYEQVDLGFNYRMTEIQAALGLSQMNRLDDFVSKRHEIFNRYNELFSGANIIKPWQNPDSYSSLHLYVIRLKFNLKNPSNHKELFKSMIESGIGVNLHYIPIYKQPYFKKFNFNPKDFPESEKYYKEAISIPIYPDLSIKDQDKVIKIIRDKV